MHVSRTAEKSDCFKPADAREAPLDAFTSLSSGGTDSMTFT
jgi:hypothetical protein